MDRPEDRETMPGAPENEQEEGQESASPLQAEAPTAASGLSASSPQGSPGPLPAAPPAGSAPRPDARAEGRRKKRGFFSVLGITLLLILAAALLGSGGLLAWSAFDRAEPLELIPDDFSAWARAESAYDLVSKLLGLEAADLVLADPAFRQARAAVTALKVSPALASPLVRALADVRVDAAVYPGGGWLAVARLGIRSAATRLAFAGRGLSARLARLEGFGYSGEGGFPRFELALRGKDGKAAPPLYIGRRKDLVLVASSLDLLEKALDGERRRVEDEGLREALARPLEGSIRFLVRPESWLGGLRSQDTGLAAALGELSFPSYASVDISLSKESISLAAALPVGSEEPALAALVKSRSPAPAIVSLYPASLRYASVLAAGRPSTLLELAGPRLGPDFPEALKKAEEAAKLAFGAGLEELLYSWAGGELGVLGLGEEEVPVFFLRVQDERKRKRAFDRLTASLLADAGRAAELEGVRLERIELPWFLETILNAAGLSLPEPWYLVSGGFLFLSERPAPLGLLGKAIREGDFLARSERWKRSGGAVPAAAAVEIVYSLDEAIPFFLRGSSRSAEALRLYRDGVATLRFDNGVLRLALAARASEGRGLAILPGFPLEAKARPSSAALVLSPRRMPPRLYWIEEGRTLVEYDPAAGERREAELDDEAWLALEPGAAVWALSSRGAVYRFLPGLETASGFPLATGYAPSAPPAWAGEGLLVPVREPAGILAVDRAGSARLLVEGLEAPLLSPPTWRAGSLAFYPKRFDGLIHLTDDSGAERPGWPVEAPGLGFGSPLLMGGSGGELLAFLSQAGQLELLFAADPNGPGRRSLLLDGVFYAGLSYAPGSKTLYALAEDGRVWKLEGEGQPEASEAPGGGSGAARLPRGKEARLALKDIDGDGREEIFLYGSGGSIGALGSSLTPLEGFPVAGGREPSFGDLDGDGRLDLVTAGFDKKIYAWEFRK